VLYIGKAKSLRIRVKSYFQPPVKLLPKTAALVAQIASIEHIEVYSEIEALLLESKLIKKFKPPFNVVAKDDRLPYYIHITVEKFPKPIINHEPQGAIAGPFLSGFITKKILRQLRRIVPFCTATRKVSRGCLYSHLGLCHPCPNDPQTQPLAYRKNISRLKRLLTGQFPAVKRSLVRHMHEAVKAEDFETAARIRDNLRHMDWILVQPVQPEEYLVNPNLVADKQQEAITALQEILQLKTPLSRIEMFDVANLSGAAATAAMTVAIDGEIDSKNYRHFTIKTKSTPDDVAMLQEVLTRRLQRQDWTKPDLIVLDGGKSQLSIVNWPIPTVGLAKREEIITLPTTEGFKEIKLDRRHPGLQLLQRLRDEAHRFSRRLHHKHRQLL